MADNKKLGRGLDAIFGNDVSSVLEDIQQGTSDLFEGIKTRLDVSMIRVNPYQPRRHFDEVKLAELADSIQQHGLFTPILVRESTQGYELIAGERRLRAAKLAQLESIPAIVVDFTDEQMMEISIIENIQREDLNVIEEALGYAMLIDKLHLTQEEVAGRVNKSRSHVTNLLRLLKLPAKVQAMVSDNQLSMGHVRPLITLDDPKQIEAYAQEIRDRKLSVREAERLVAPKVQAKNKPMTTDYRYAQSLFEQKLQTRVAIEGKRISIFFTDDEDLNRIIEELDLME